MSRNRVKLLSLRPKHLSYVIRLQDQPQEPMFRPELYSFSDVEAPNYIISNNTKRNSILDVDKHLALDQATKFNDNEHINENTNSNDSTDTTNITLVNSTVSDNSFGDNVNQDIPNSSSNSNKVQLGTKRKIYTQDDTDSPSQHKRFKLDNSNLATQKQQFISSDFLPSSDDVDLVLKETQNTSQCEQNFMFSQLILSQTSTAVKTNQQINHTLLSSFDPIFSSEN